MFDRIVVVDWSANSTPKSGADSIWVSCLDDGGVPTAVNHRTRAAAFDALVELLDMPGRVLAGFDFPLGYPAGTAAALGLGGVPWSATWSTLAEQLHDDDRNRNNRWEVAADWNRRFGRLHFWGAPPSRAGEHLTSRRPPWTDEHLVPYRAVEARLRSQGTRPFSVWQLLGAGSVGSQVLTGIPVLQRLRTHPRVGARTAVWPFETGLAPPSSPDAIVLAEVWPSAIPFHHVDHPVKDARQVIALATWLAEQPAELFGPTVDDPVSVTAEEGWVLGVR